MLDGYIERLYRGERLTELEVRVRCVRALSGVPAQNSVQPTSGRADYRVQRAPHKYTGHHLW